MYVFVLSKTGKRLMPTNEYRARRLLKSGKAVIEKHSPFTIRLTEREGGEVQPVEYKCDTGYQHIGISICSENHEYVNEQRNLLPDETERHNDRRKYRRARRSRKRYRKPRFDNRARKPRTSGKWFAPSIDNKMEQHMLLYKRYHNVLPVTSAVFEMGNFDMQLLKAMEEGAPLPKGKDYQHGDQYGFATLREAVFFRDGYECQCCGEGLKDGSILSVHHIGFWKQDRTDRMSNLMTVCSKCHTPKNHKPEGKLYGLEPTLKAFTGASFMTSVKWALLALAKEVDSSVDVKIVYGAMTKLKRKALGLKKTHSNDAYAMGEFHPKHRTDIARYKKRRRNNRVLEKFYDAKYIDVRDGSKKKGAQLGCNRINRREPRMSNKNERIYRGHKTSKGRRTIRKKRYCIQPGTIVLLDHKQYVSKGVQNYGNYTTLEGHKAVRAKDLMIIRQSDGWIKL